MIKKIIEEIKGFFSWWTFSIGAAKKRQEWYRNEIIKAFEAKDFEKAAILQQEMQR